MIIQVQMNYGKDFNVNKFERWGDPLDPPLDTMNQTKTCLKCYLFTRN